MSDPFEAYADSPTRPPKHAAEVTPSDTQDLATFASCLRIGDDGNVRVTTIGGEVVTFPCKAGDWLLLGVRRVHEEGTTATNIVALW